MGKHGNRRPGNLRTILVAFSVIGHAARVLATKTYRPLRAGLALWQGGVDVPLHGHDWQAAANGMTGFAGGQDQSVMLWQGNADFFLCFAAGSDDGESSPASRSPGRAQWPDHGSVGFSLRRINKTCGVVFRHVTASAITTATAALPAHGANAVWFGAASGFAWCSQRMPRWHARF